MNRKTTTYPFFLLVLFTILWGACQNTDAPSEEEEAINVEALIPGTWEAVSMYVEVNSVNGEVDSNYIFRINDGDWASLYNVSPPRTFFEKDHKYRVEFRDQRDSIMDMSQGIWNVVGDTLMMIERNNTFQYKVSEDKGLIFFRGFRDWDEDGAEDDNYIEVKRRVSIGTN